MSGNQLYQGDPPPPANQLNQPPYQLPSMNQQAGGFQVANQYGLGCIGM